MDEKNTIKKGTLKDLLENKEITYGEILYWNENQLKELAIKAGETAISKYSNLLKYESFIKDLNIKVTTNITSNKIIKFIKKYCQNIVNANNIIEKHKGILDHSTSGELIDAIKTCSKIKEAVSELTKTLSIYENEFFENVMFIIIRLAETDGSFKKYSILNDEGLDRKLLKLISERTTCDNYSYWETSITTGEKNSISIKKNPFEKSIDGLTSFFDASDIGELISYLVKSCSDVDNSTCANSSRYKLNLDFQNPIDPTKFLEGKEFEKVIFESDFETFEINKQNSRNISNLFNRIIHCETKCIDESETKEKILVLLYILKCTGITPIDEEGNPIDILKNAVDDNSLKKLKQIIEIPFSCFNNESFDITQAPNIINKSHDLAELRANDGWDIYVPNTYTREDYDKEKNCLADKLNKCIIENTSPEFKFFFLGEYGQAKNKVTKEAIDILKIISKIKIGKNPSHGNLTFTIKTSPLYSACLNKLNEKIANIFKKTYCDEYGSFEIKLAFGKLAENIKETYSPHVFKSNDFIEVNSNLKEETLKSILENSKDSIVKEYDSHKNHYVFSSKWERIFLEGFFYAKTSKNKKVEDICSDMIKYDIPRKYDHLHYNVAATCLFAVSVYRNIDNTEKKEKVISSLCKKANNYMAQARPEQVSALMILTYLLYTEKDVSFQLKKEMFRACFLKQLYPQQIPILRYLIENDKFFKEYPVKQFQKSLILNKNKYMGGQPEFFLLQGICNKNHNEDQSLLSKAITFQDEVWIEKKTRKHSGNNCNAVKTLLERIAIEGEDNEFFTGNDAPANIIANNLVFYGLSDIAHENENSASKLLGKYLNKSSLKDNFTEDKLLEKIINTDYYQRLSNPKYQKEKIDEKIQNELILLCGPSRMMNSYSFKLKYSLSETMAKEYSNYLKKEDIHKRYFWFLVRMMLNCTINNKDFDLESIFKEKIVNFKKEDINSVKNILKEIVFLDYDHFPSNEKLYKARSYEELMNLIRTPNFSKQ